MYSEGNYSKTYFRTNLTNIYLSFNIAFGIFLLFMQFSNACFCVSMYIIFYFTCALGILRQRDYIADHAGYRITKSKNLYVGRNIPVGEAVKLAKKYTSSADTLISFKPRPSAVNSEYNQATQNGSILFYSHLFFYYF